MPKTRDNSAPGGKEMLAQGAGKEASAEETGVPTDGRGNGEADIGREGSLESLSNGLRCLSLYGREVDSLTIQDVAFQLAITRPAARRILLTLGRLGYLEQVERNFHITPKVLELGFAYFAAKGLRGIAVPYMEAVAAKTGETCALAVLDGSDIVFLHRAEANKPMRLDLTIGSRLPAYAHSMGRILLAGLSDEDLSSYLASVRWHAFTPKTIVEPEAMREEINRVREKGWSFSNGELMDGIAGIARPIVDASGRPVAAINISMILGSRTPEFVVKEMLPHLTHASETISRLQSAVQ